MEPSMSVSVYEAQADSVNVDNIATNSDNRFVLWRIKRNNAYDNFNELYIQNEHDRVGEHCIDYVPEGANDMGWLGYFVGKNVHLENLFILPFEPPSGSSVRDVIGPFFRGINHNKSIQKIEFSGVDLLGGEVFTMLTPFFKNNYNLTNITISECDFGDEGVRLFSLAIGNCKNKSLQKVELGNNDIADEGMVNILTALSVHLHLKRLDLGGNRLRKNACVALATLLQCSAAELQHLFLLNNEINDDGIEALVPSLKNCHHLRDLWLSSNPTITTRGWQRLASILESPNCNLEILAVELNCIDDEAVTAFANALANNRTLHALSMKGNSSTTNIGWEAFSKLLCNTSSVNATFLSNHTLVSVGNPTNAHVNEIIRPLLRLNEGYDKKEVAVIKILQNHEDFDMLPFFEWEFKVLPLAISWLERASECEMPENFEPNIERRKLSTIYQFVRGMPVLYVETRLRKELEDLKEEQRMLNQRNLEIEQRKISIMKALGKQ